MINNKDIFESIIPWVLEFIIAGREIIRLEKTDIIQISLPNKTLIKLHNIT